jgi:hypothetical protein
VALGPYDGKSRGFDGEERSTCDAASAQHEGNRSGKCYKKSGGSKQQAIVRITSGVRSNWNIVIAQRNVIPRPLLRSKYPARRSCTTCSRTSMFIMQWQCRSSTVWTGGDQHLGHIHSHSCSCLINSQTQAPPEFRSEPSFPRLKIRLPCIISLH